MRYLLALLFVLCVILEAQERKPLARGNLDTTSGILGPHGECPPSLGGRMEEWCMIATKCFDSTCVNSMSGEFPEVPGSDHGNKLYSIYPIEICEEYPKKYDTTYISLRARIKSGQKICLDSIRAALHSAQDTSGCYLSIYDQLTVADKVRMSKREVFADTLIAPVSIWKYQCEN